MHSVGLSPRRQQSVISSSSSGQLIVNSLPHTRPQFFTFNPSNRGVTALYHRNFLASAEAR